jgi:hypothetical protein
MSQAPEFNMDLSIASKPGYLGRSEVVGGLIENFIQEGVLGAKEPTHAVMAAHRMALIFSGQIKGYTPVPGWEKDMTEVLCRRLQIDPSQSPRDILHTAFLDTTEAVYKAVKTLMGDALDAEIRDISTFLAHLLLGTADAIYRPVR